MRPKNLYGKDRNTKPRLNRLLDTVKVRRDPQGQLLNFADNSWVKIIIFPRGIKKMLRYWSPDLFSLCLMRIYLKNYLMHPG